MNFGHSTSQIVEWLQTQVKGSQQKGFVIGISGGIDSAVTSTLCAKTGLPTIGITMPILQQKDQHDRAHEHLRWLENNFNNVSRQEVDLTQLFLDFKKALPKQIDTELAMANSRSRLRMTTLYAFANAHGYLVAGTGNKIEDEAIGFFTKYGDGGIDISPIGDLVKSEVYGMAVYLGVAESLRQAAPTDGLWGDDRNDETQIGASYDELEWAMSFCQQHNLSKIEDIEFQQEITNREQNVLKIYLTRHLANRHKMKMPPVCQLTH